jgi:hypothetical protein
MSKRRTAEVRKLQQVLGMLYDLLEGHAPTWYTEQCHDQAHAALRDVKDEDVTQGFDSLGASPVLLQHD